MMKRGDIVFFFKSKNEPVNALVAEVEDGQMLSLVWVRQESPPIQVEIHVPLEHPDAEGRRYKIP